MLCPSFEVATTTYTAIIISDYHLENVYLKCKFKLKMGKYQVF